MKVILILSMLSIVLGGTCQDMQFTQFNAAPLYLNPAFTGATIEHRFATNYRNQWTAIPGHFVNYTFAYDYNLAEFNSGIGLLFAREQAGTGGLGNTEIGFLYSYHFRIDNKVFIQPGIKFNYISRGVDFSKLVFNDQLARGGPANGPSSDDIELNNVSYIDVTAGFLVYSAKYWAGVSFNHINEPNQSLTNDESPLFMKFSAHGGYKIELSEGGRKTLNTSYFNIAAHYKAQQKFDQLDLGVYYTREPFTFGVWYRGLPGIKSYEGVLNNDALAIILGYQVIDYNLKIGYSYDVTVSRLAANSAGSHEISLIYEVASKKKKRRSRRFFVPCAKF
ncbi:MAG: type IX secretion system membrane protein PorP/SprF [Flavobacteriales bacterium]|nr:type IX secretion system membrane protein PorP/SprF [Flavobacteriales bacterium]